MCGDYVRSIGVGIHALCTSVKRRRRPSIDRAQPNRTAPHQSNPNQSQHPTSTSTKPPKKIGGLLGGLRPLSALRPKDHGRARQRVRCGNALRCGWVDFWGSICTSIHPSIHIHDRIDPTPTPQITSPHHHHQNQIPKNSFLLPYDGPERCRGYESRMINFYRSVFFLFGGGVDRCGLIS